LLRRSISFRLRSRLCCSPVKLSHVAGKDGVNFTMFRLHGGVAAGKYISVFLHKIQRTPADTYRHLQSVSVKVCKGL
jgi:hypothetical protein